MEYIIAQNKAEIVYKTRTAQHSIVNRFFDWASAQNAQYRIGWAGVSLIVMAAVLFPLTMAVILINGAAFSLIIAAMTSLALVVIVNLAALPTRYTIPALFLGIVINVLAVIVSFL